MADILLPNLEFICLDWGVAVPEETIWTIEPHTAAKHLILRKYLDAWFPILNSYKRKIYIDGFAGPGRYSGDEPGSPIVALESARTHRASLSGELVFWFIEERQDRAEHLRGEVAQIQLPANFKVNIDTFADNLKKALDEMDRDRTQVPPTFALIDPFGFSAIPYPLIQRLLSKDRCEALITFMVDSINRWLTHPDEQILAHIVETFGTEDALRIATGRGDRAKALKDLYYRQLKQIVRFVRYFEMRDYKGRVVYYLFFASNNRLGHLKMKEAMWKVDRLGDFSFSDSTDPKQEVLFTSPSVAGLGAELRSKFRKAGLLRARRVREFVEDETAYLSKHMREALMQLEESPTPTLKVEPKKADGKARRAGTYPDDALLSFS